MGGFARRGAVSASLRAARSCRRAVGRASAARAKQPPHPARRSLRVNALFGLGQSLLLALPPERAHDLAIKSLELGLYPRASQPDDKRLFPHLPRPPFSTPP